MTKKIISKTIKNEAGEDVVVTEEVEVVEETTQTTTDTVDKEKDTNPLNKIKQALDKNTENNKEPSKNNESETPNAELNALVETLKQEKANLLKIRKISKVSEYKNSNGF